ncbi:hypothetical protein [Dyella sp.]|uniref:hypothetical protein n=1 Tax=Dyella sp. TaxID=1869338 RepID=UPI003F819CE3
MKFLRSTAIAFFFAFVGAFIAMLINHWLGLAPIQLGLVIGIASGWALGFGIKIYLQLPRSQGLALVCTLVGFGALASHWLSAHA